jgi:endonuclease/exonuclease/phosphatase family metal-dependent hydrolase
MASANVPAPHDNLTILVMNADYSHYVSDRTVAIEAFLQRVDPRPDVLLLQNVEKTVYSPTRSYDQRTIFLEALGGDNTYTKIEMLEKENLFGNFPKRNSYNMIMAKLEGEQIPSEVQEKWYCAGKFTFKNKFILMISYHGDPSHLVEHLEMFLKLQENKECKHLIIGGDFGFNMDQLELGENLRKLFKIFQLNIVTYKNQGRAKTVTLICNESLFNTTNVTVYSNKKRNPLLDYNDNGTFVKYFHFSRNTLTLDPIMINIQTRSTAPTEDPCNDLAFRLSHKAIIFGKEEEINSANQKTALEVEPALPAKEPVSQEQDFEGEPKTERVSLEAELDAISKELVATKEEQALGQESVATKEEQALGQKPVAPITETVTYVQKLELEPVTSAKEPDATAEEADVKVKPEPVILAEEADSTAETDDPTLEDSDLEEEPDLQEDSDLLEDSDLQEDSDLEVEPKPERIPLTENDKGEDLAVAFETGQAEDKTKGKPKTKKNRKGNGNEAEQVQDDLTEERDETENIEEVTKSQQEKVEPEKSKKSIEKVEPEKSKKSIADTGLKKELTAEEKAKRLEDWKKEIEKFLKKLGLSVHLKKEQSKDSATDIQIVLMNVGNSEKLTEDTLALTENLSENTTVHSSEKLYEISSEQLTGNSKKNPPKLLIFYQEGSPEKDAHMTATLGDSNYSIMFTEEGNVKTNGIIYHTGFDLTAPKEAVKMELYIPITVTTKYEKNTPPYFFMFDSHRFCLAIYTYGVKMKSLMVSFHGPNIADGLTDIRKAKNIEHYLTFFDLVRVAHSCQTMIVAGDFNIKYSDLQANCNILLENLDLTVMQYNLGPEHHRSVQSARGRNKELVDTIIHSNSISVVEGSIVVDKDIPAEIMDHHPILVTLRLPNEAEVEQREQVLQ